MNLSMQTPGKAGGYREIFAWIADGIRSGRWRPGDRLPTEAELVCQFRVSRMTVSRALTDLAGLRLVERRRGAGSFVAESGGAVPLFAARDVAEELRTTREGFSVQVLLRASEPWPAAHRHAGAPARCVHSVLVYATLEGPVQAEERWVNPAEVPAYATADLAHTSTFSLLAAVRADEIETRLTATRPSTVDARRLACSRAQPCWMLERTSWRAAVLVSHSRIVSRGDRYVLRDQVKRERSPHPGRAV